MFTTLVALSLFSGPTTIDFDHPGAPVSRVVEAMGKAYGIEATADATMSRDFVIVALRHETVERARSLISDALNATWVEKDGRWRLTRTADQSLQDERREHQWVVESLTKAQAAIKVPPRLSGDSAEALVKEVVAASTSSVPIQIESSRGGNLPGHRAAARVLTSFEPKVLASLPQNAPVAFNLSGARGHERLPNAARSVLNEFITDHFGMRDLFSIRAANIDPPRGLDDFQRSPDAITAVLTRTDQFVMCDMVVRREGSFMSLTFTASLGAPSAQIPSPVWPSELDATIEFSELAKQRMALRPVWAESISIVPQPSAELLDVFLKPRTHDPWELATSEAVRQAADAMGRSFIVVPIDQMIGLESRLARSQPTLRTALEALFTKFVYEAQVTNTEVFVRPRGAASARAGRVGRTELATALTSLRSRSGGTLEALAELAATSYPFTNLWTTPLSGLSGAVMSNSFAGGEVLLVVYAELNASQKRSAQDGGIVLDPSQLSKSAKTVISAILARKQQEYHSDFHDRSASNGESISAWYESLLRADIGSQQLKIEVVARETLFLKGAEQPSGIYAQPTSIANRGRLAAYSERYPDFEDDPVVYRMVKERGVVASLVGPEGEVFLEAYFAPSIYAGDKFGPIESLPQTALAEYKREYEAEKKRLGGGVIPPSRR